MYTILHSVIYVMLLQRMTYMYVCARVKTVSVYSFMVVSIIIDYRATYVYGIGNGRALLIVLHWAALIPSSEYIALTKIN